MCGRWKEFYDEAARLPEHGENVWMSESAFVREIGETVVKLQKLVPEQANRRTVRDLAAALAEHQTGGAVSDLFVATAAVAAAETSEGVYEALVLYTAPPGSFRDKRGRPNPGPTVSVNAYVGVIAGAEYVEGADGEVERAFHGGAFIPVGLEVAWGKRWGSLGVFASPFNLGTYADFGAEEPAYSFAQLWSPSAYGVVGLGHDLPVSLGAGVSYVPVFRAEADEEAQGAWRASFFAAVDIPLWIWRGD